MACIKNCPSSLSKGEGFFLPWTCCEHHIPALCKRFKYTMEFKKLNFPENIELK